MATSQNGWSVVSRSGLVNIKTSTGWKIPVRKGDVAVIFKEYIRWYEEEIEPLVHGWSWGWAPRKVRGGTSISNHASATGLDTNAPKHPLGKRNTFTPSQRAKIRKKTKELGLRWGGDYKSRPDDMHVEINVSASTAKKIASRISGKKPSSNPKAPPKKTNPKKYPTLKIGSKGPAVKRWQQILNKWYPNDIRLTVDSEFGRQVDKATRLFQSRNGLKVDGVAGEKTLKKARW